MFSSFILCLGWAQLDIRIGTLVANVCNVHITNRPVDAAFAKRGKASEILCYNYWCYHCAVADPVIVTGFDFLSNFILSGTATSNHAWVFSSLFYSIKTTWNFSTLLPFLWSVGAYHNSQVLAVLAGLKKASSPSRLWQIALGWVHFAIVGTRMSRSFERVL